MWGEMNVEREKETTLGWSLIIPTHPFQGETDQILIDAQHDALFFHIPKKGKWSSKPKSCCIKPKNWMGGMIET
jgi:hypothetical protein